MAMYFETFFSLRPRDVNQCQSIAANDQVHTHDETGNEVDMGGDLRGNRCASAVPRNSSCAILLRKDDVPDWNVSREPDAIGRQVELEPVLVHTSGLDD
jgi:hypothetical protein